MLAIFAGGNAVPNPLAWDSPWFKPKDAEGKEIAQFKAGLQGTLSPALSILPFVGPFAGAAMTKPGRKALFATALGNQMIGSKFAAKWLPDARPFSEQLARMGLKGNAVDQTRAMTVEIEGVDKPALVAEWIGRTVFA